jgi:hypothetical protein
VGLFLEMDNIYTKETFNGKHPANKPKSEAFSHLTFQGIRLLLGLN